MKINVARAVASVARFVIEHYVLYTATIHCKKRVVILTVRYSWLLQSQHRQSLFFVTIYTTSQEVRIK